MPTSTRKGKYIKNFKKGDYMSGLKKQIPASKTFKIIFFTVIIPTLIMIIGAVMVINAIREPMCIEPHLTGEIYEIEKFNSQFINFEGNIKGSEIKKLLIEIIDFNENAMEVSSWLNDQKSSDNEFILNLIKEVDLESTYTVTFDYNNEGWITCINIDQN